MKERLVKWTAPLGLVVQTQTFYRRGLSPVVRLPQEKCRMRILSIIALLSWCQPGAAQGFRSFTAHGSTVVYELPDSTVWRVVKYEIASDGGEHVLMFKHSPILDSLGRQIQPVMAIISEPVHDSLDVIEYSLLKRSQIRFEVEVERVLTHEDGHFSYPNAIGFDGKYGEEVIHKIIVGYLRHKQAGVQIICDSTPGVFRGVEPGMRAFLHSVSFKE